MRDVFHVPDFSQPCGAVATFDAAVADCDLERAISQIRFDTPHGEKIFRQKIAMLGDSWFSRQRAHNWSYRRRTDELCTVERYGFLSDGSLGLDKFKTAYIDNEWRMTTAPSTEIWKVHPDLGAIHFNEYWWETHRLIPALGHVAFVDIPGSELGPSPEHVDIALLIVGHAQDEREKMCAKLFTYYHENVVGFFTDYDEDGNDLTDFNVPKVTHPLEMWEMLWPPFRIRISEHASASAMKFTLDCECRWDKEHGLGIRFCNWAVDGFCGNGE